MQSLYSVVLTSPGLGAPTQVTVVALTSRTIGLNWQVSDCHVTCSLATSRLLHVDFPFSTECVQTDKTCL